jgi:hypothetical protein
MQVWLREGAYRHLYAGDIWCDAAVHTHAAGRPKHVLCRAMMPTRLQNSILQAEGPNVFGYPKRWWYADSVCMATYSLLENSC